MFDFDGDGQPEAIYADECFLRVHNGKTGDVLFSSYRTSGTWYESPVVADVDKDDNTEIVVNSNKQLCTSYTDGPVPTGGCKLVFCAIDQGVIGKDVSLIVQSRCDGRGDHGRMPAGQQSQHYHRERVATSKCRAEPSESRLPPCGGRALRGGRAHVETCQRGLSKFSRPLWQNAICTNLA